MKRLLNIALIILALLILATLLFWAMALGSGHTLPKATTNTLLINLLVLVSLCGIVIGIKKYLGKAKRR